jgi:hypothetical protein
MSVQLFWRLYNQYNEILASCFAEMFEHKIYLQDNISDKLLFLKCYFLMISLAFRTKMTLFLYKLLDRIKGIATSLSFKFHFNWQIDNEHCLWLFINILCFIKMVGIQIHNNLI